MHFDSKLYKFINEKMLILFARSQFSIKSKLLADKSSEQIPKTTIRFEIKNKRENIVEVELQNNKSQVTSDVMPGKFPSFKCWHMLVLSGI